MAADQTAMKRCDVCVITTIHPPFEARIWARGVLPLLEAGFSVCLVSSWRVPVTPSATGSFQSMRVRAPATRRGRVLYTVRVFLRAVRYRAHAYHFHDLDFLPFGVLLKLMTGAHVIYDCHENYPLQVRNDKPWIPRAIRCGLSWAIEIVERRCAGLLRLCIVPLPEMEDRFRHAGAAVTTIQNRTAWPAARELLHGPDIVYSGSVGENYGMNVLIGIARELKRRNMSANLVITLKNALPRDRDALLGAITRETLPIEIHEQVPADRIGTFLCRGEIGLSLEQDTPEKRKALPGKLFEYMAFGLPIISSDIPHNSRIIRQAGCGFVVPASEPAAYADAIQRVLADRRLLEQLRENGFHALETQFSWNREKEKLMELYGRLLRHRRGTATVT